MRHWLLILLVSLMSNLLSTSLSAGSCYVSIKTSGDFNPALISEISTSLVSQYIKEVLTIPSSGIRGDTKCVYDVSVTSDATSRSRNILDPSTTPQPDHTSLCIF